MDVLLPTGATTLGEFLLWEESPSNQDWVRLVLRFSGREYEGAAEGFFDALVKIRSRLEAETILLNCFGSSRNVFPSPMILSMGPGMKAYRLKMGASTKMEDLVCIFEHGPDIQPATIIEQEEFYREWLKSLR